MMSGLVPSPLRPEIPIDRNQKLAAIMDRLEGDRQLTGWWHAALINAGRTGEAPQWRTNFELVPRLTLELLRRLVASDIQPSLVRDYGYHRHDSEVVVALGALLRFARVSIDDPRSGPAHLFLLARKLPDLLRPVYDEPDRTVLAAEVLHAVAVAGGLVSPLTLEAEIVRLAVALNVHDWPSKLSPGLRPAVAGGAPADVVIGSGARSPLRIELRLRKQAAIASVDEVIDRNLRGTVLAGYTELEVVESSTGDLLLRWPPPLARS
jgi:uncharacterized protein